MVALNGLTRQAALMYSPAEVIREARRQRGWGQRRLAEVCGVTQPNVSAYETGQRVPSLAMLRRLIGACGLQIRFDLEPRWADVDDRIDELLATDPDIRIGPLAHRPAVTVAVLAGAGARLVIDGHLAARILGAPVSDTPQRVWCAMPDLEEFLQVARGCRFGARPVRPRYADDDDEYRLVYHVGDEIASGEAVVTLGEPPPPRWWCPILGTRVPVVGLDALRTGQVWRGADRIALERLSTVVADRGEDCLGLDPYP